jgi:hypothetical protein
VAQAAALSVKAEISPPRWLRTQIARGKSAADLWELEPTGPMSERV